MNGDDGYTNGGGGGSVWWEVAVSEGELETSEKAKFNATCPDPRFKPHKAAKPNHARYMVTGHDSFREEKKEPNEAGYFEITIPDASQITHVELDVKTLRFFMPIDSAHGKVEQYRVSWGMREKMAKNVWGQLRAALKDFAK